MFSLVVVTEMLKKNWVLPVFDGAESLFKFIEPIPLYDEMFSLDEMKKGCSGRDMLLIRLTFL